MASMAAIHREKARILSDAGMAVVSFDCSGKVFRPGCLLLADRLLRTWRITTRRTSGDAEQIDQLLCFGPIEAPPGDFTKMIFRRFQACPGSATHGRSPVLPHVWCIVDSVVLTMRLFDFVKQVRIV